MDFPYNGQQRWEKWFFVWTKYVWRRLNIRLEKKELNSLMIYQSELQHKSVTTFYWSVFKSNRQVWVTLLMMIYTSHNLFITHALSKDTICWTVWSHCRGSSSLLFGIQSLHIVLPYFQEMSCHSRQRDNSQSSNSNLVEFRGILVSQDTWLDTITALITVFWVVTKSCFSSRVL